MGYKYYWFERKPTAEDVADLINETVISVTHGGIQTGGPNGEIKQGVCIETEEELVPGKLTVLDLLFEKRYEREE